MLYTANIKYRGADRIDITVKSGEGIIGQLLAPTWDMVMQYKRTGDQKVYTDAYYSLVISRFKYDDLPETKILRTMVTHAMVDDVTLVCYCKPGDFCHRTLAVRLIDHNLKAILRLPPTAEKPQIIGGER